MSRKPKLNVRISPELLAKVDAAASSPRVTKAEVVERGSDRALRSRPRR